jgi:hypothetical protein
MAFIATILERERWGECVVSAGGNKLAARARVEKKGG